jgi:hypothetical protein
MALLSQLMAARTARAGHSHRAMGMLQKIYRKKFRVDLGFVR